MGFDVMGAKWKNKIKLEYNLTLRYRLLGSIHKKSIVMEFETTSSYWTLVGIACAGETLIGLL